MGSLRDLLRRWREPGKGALRRLPQTLICPEERLATTLPVNVQALENLPSERMQFGFSFRDVPGMVLSKCNLVVADECALEVRRDEWDSVFVDVRLANGVRLPIRGTGLPDALPTAQTGSEVHVERGALALETWSGNYGHWVVYHLPKLLAFVEHGWQASIFLPARGRWTAVEDRDAEFLRLLTGGGQASPVLRLEQGRTVVSKLAVVDGDPHHAALLRAAAVRLKNAATNCGISPQRHPKRVLISRRGARWRGICNQDELIERLHALGFEEVCLEALPLHDQIRMFAELECVVSVHGSGFANLIFTSADTKVVEIVPREFPCPDFYRLAVTLGLAYALVLADAAGQGEPGYRDVLVPVEEVACVVRSLLPGNAS